MQKMTHTHNKNHDQTNTTETTSTQNEMENDPFCRCYKNQEEINENMMLHCSRLNSHKVKLILALRQVNLQDININVLITGGDDPINEALHIERYKDSPTKN